MSEQALYEMPIGKLLDAAAAAGVVVGAQGDRLVIRGPRSAEALGGVLLARKAEVLPLLRAEPPSVGAEPSPAAPEAGVAVLERRGHLLRLPGLGGWLSLHDLKPCGGCRSTRYRIGSQRLFCPRCLKALPGEVVGQEIDVSALATDAAGAEPEGAMASG
jgi:hypothetical protein